MRGNRNPIALQFLYTERNKPVRLLTMRERSGAEVNENSSYKGRNSIQKSDGFVVAWTRFAQ